MDARRGLVLVATALLATASCSTSDSSPGSGTAGFASYAGVLGCAELVAWGRVTGSEPVGELLDVGFAVEEWIHPDAGAAATTFLADDPAREVGAPAWSASPERVLVVVPGVGPADRLGAVEGARAVAQWRAAGSPRLATEQCDQA